MLLMLPALIERRDYYRVNALWMEQTRGALAADKDLPLVLAALHSLPPGRTYAGLRSNWGKTLNWGYLHFYDLLPFESVVAMSPPYYAFSLNADLIWGPRRAQSRAIQTVRCPVRSSTVIASNAGLSPADPQDQPIHSVPSR